MDYIIFNQPGGFPLTTNILDAMQAMYQPFLNGLGAMAGTRAIISGCQKNGNTVSAGLIQIDGEMYGLVEGIEQEYITIKEDKKIYEFENGNENITVVYRYAVFGTGTDPYKWADFKRVPILSEIPDFMQYVNDTIEDFRKKLTPIGTICMWSGNPEQIPAGWWLCDGSNGTPDLRGRFIVGYDGGGYQVGNTGGDMFVTLNYNQMPAHTHRAWTTWGGEHNHDYIKAVPGRGYKTKRDDSPFQGYVTEKTSWNGGHNHQVQMDSAGANEAHENRPPFYTLAYIMFKNE